MEKQDIFDILEKIPDPEIPVISIVELGIIRDVTFLDNSLEVIITPTYSGCPAMSEIERDVIKKLKENGFDNISVKTVLAPAWTTDWMSEESKLKLKNYGIAPPDKTKEDSMFNILAEPKKVSCPFCDSEDTVKRSDFGSTACKSLHHCNSCLEAFEHFKCH